MLWQGVAVATTVVAERRAARVAAVEEVLRSLQPPAGFRAASCDVESPVCMRGDTLPEQSADEVAALLEPHAAATESRCFKRFRKAPADCWVLADVHGVTVGAWLNPRLMPEPPIRFEGSDLSFITVQGSYAPAVFFTLQQDAVGGRA